MAAARAEHDAGDLLGNEGRAFQDRRDAALERDSEYAAWADRRYLERWGVPRPPGRNTRPEASMTENQQGSEQERGQAEAGARCPRR
jgi:hypothetical protein